MFLKGRLFGAILALGWLVFGPISLGQGPSPFVSPARGVETWEINTRACPEEMGSSPWGCVQVNRLDEPSWTLVGSEPGALLASMAGRRVVILIHGNGYDNTESTMEGLLVRDQLAAAGGLPEGSLFVIFDWSSERSLPSLVRDLNEKARRSRIAAFHLATILQASPPGSTIAFMGQSLGGRISLSTMHLLSGAELPGFLREPGGQLSSGRPDLRLRCVALEAAAGHHWLNPGERLEHALPSCEALLNLHNPGDYALAVFVFGSYTGLRPALGLRGLNSRDRELLGPLSNRIEQINHHSLSRRDHTLFTKALTFPQVARRIAAYTSFSDVSDGQGKSFKTR